MMGLVLGVILAGVVVWLVRYHYRKVYREGWPTWRYDARRSASSPETLPETLHLQWVRHLAPPRPAWPPEQYKLQFDRSYEPIVWAGLVFIPSMVSDCLIACDIGDGREQWRFYTDGPIRFAPVGWRDKVYVVSDDGYLYCLNARTGALRWKFRGGPTDRKVLGNDRLISTWPARGGPVLYEGKIYFTAGIWPFMGIFIHCLEAETGREVWTDSGSGSMYLTQPHNSPAFGGVAPQGYLAADETHLMLPGRTTPACYDRETGRFRYYNLSDRGFGKYVGGYQVALWKDWFFNNEIIYRLSDGQGLGRKKLSVLSEEVLIGLNAKEIQAFTLSEGSAKAEGVWKFTIDVPWEHIHLRAGSRVYGASPDGLVGAIDLPTGDRSAQLTWQSKVSGAVWSMAAAYGKLFVTTRDGSLYCFGGKRTRRRTYRLDHSAIKDSSASWGSEVGELLDYCDNPEGYAVVAGVGKGHLLRELLRQTKLHVIFIDSDSKKIDRLRRELDAAGVYGRRAGGLVGDFESVELPAYFANLVVSEDLAGAGFGRSANFVENVFHCLRPYGGVAYFEASAEDQLRFYRQVEGAELAGRKVFSVGSRIVLKRVGALPEAGVWTHQYGDVGNSNLSRDKRVKAPLGLLWFGDRSSFTDVLPRHGHGPPEQVIGGRLFIEGMKSLSARDVYTGRILWKRELENLNTFNQYYDDSYIPDPFNKSYNQLHMPGANSRGTNFIATEERVYVVEGAHCRVLDAATGQDVDTISLPPREDNKPAEWGYIGLYKDYLIATSGFAKYTSWLKSQGNKKKDIGLKFYDSLAGKQLVVFNRHTGEVLWCRDAHHGFLHNGIVAGRDKLFCLDIRPPAIVSAMEKAGVRSEKNERLLALEISSGKIIWEKTEDVFGTWLGYSEPFDVLIQAYRRSRDMLPEPGNRLAAYQGEDGIGLWDLPNVYSGPCILHGGTIITQGKAYSLLTGREKQRVHPLSGELLPWRYVRNYGCNTVIGSEHLLTFRSAAAGFFDLANDGGTGNLGGFKSGCTANLVVADGVLNAPEYTRTCTCSYQNQTSLALIHVPEAEMWTFNPLPAAQGPIKRLGINLGAPGDRKDEGGTLWLDYPSVGGPSPDPLIKVVPEKPAYFRHHASLMGGEGLAWVGASGAKGLQEIRIQLIQPERRTYSISAEADDAEEGGGRVSLDSSDLELVQDKADQVIGLRFNQITIPKGMTIRSAYVQFKTDETNSEPTSLTIHGQATDHALPFSKEPNDISSRERTRASVSWQPAAWEKAGQAGAEQRTGNVSPILKEIIGRGGWKDGNSIGLIITGKGKRVACAYDGDKSGAPTLVVELVGDTESPSDAKAQRYRVKLHFLEPDQTQRAGERVFDVTIQGEAMLRDFDIRSAARGAYIPVVKEFTDILVTDTISIALSPTADSSVKEPILCGIEILAQDN